MHTLIYAIVDARTAQGAVGAATSAFDRLTGTTPGRARVFDYYCTLDDLDADHPAVEADIPVAARVDDHAGRVLLDAAWQATVEETRREVRQVRRLLADADATAVRRDEDGVRRALGRLGRPESPTTALYDHHGLGLVRRERVADEIAACDRPWIVPADAHHKP